MSAFLPVFIAYGRFWLFLSWLLINTVLKFFSIKIAKRAFLFGMDCKPCFVVWLRLLKTAF